MGIGYNYIKIMRLSFVFCLIINAVASKLHDDCDNGSDNESSESDEEGSDNIGLLDFRGKIRQLFAVEIGLDAEDGNMICSPISAMMPLAKLVFGAKRRSKTEKELLTGLGLKNARQLQAEYEETFQKLRYLKGVEISIASKFFVSEKHKLQSKFERKCYKVFNSSVELIDTELREEVADGINEWVAGHTRDRITNLISATEIDPNLSLLLVNAVYFKGLWLNQFKPATLQPFHSPAGTIDVPMMTITGQFKYVESDYLNAKIIELPYVGEEAAMIIVLPNERIGLPILLRALKVSHDLLRCEISRMRSEEVTVTIPKFQIETVMDLKTYYEKMGLSHSLTPAYSELTEIVKHERLYISSAKQKAIIEVTEEGTTAAAASVLEMIPLSSKIRLKFTADCPFLFYIRARHEQLFAGVVNRPD